MRAAALLTLLTLGVACGGAPVAPTPSTTAAQTIQSSNEFDLRAAVIPGSFGVSISVTRDGRPAGGTSVNAWVQQTGFGYSYWWAHGPARTDANGRFRFSNLAEGSKVYVQAFQEGMVQQCASPPVVIGTATADIVLDAQLTPAMQVSASASSVPPERPGFRSVFGTVVEVINGEKKPVPGAAVEYDPAPDFSVSETRSDAEGRFLLCGIPGGENAPILAWLRGRLNGYVNVVPGMAMPIEVVVPQ